MEPEFSPALMRRARGAYELGRLRRALVIGAWVVPFVVLSLAAGSTPMHALLLAVPLFFVVAGLWFRGESYARAIGPGLGLGALAALAPIVARAVSPCCIGESCGMFCLPACIGGGLLAGSLLGLRAAVEPESRGRFVLAASVTAGLAGGFGCCAIVGLGGVVGISLGVILSAPSVLLLRASSR
jgi:hypothetical protein